MIPVSREEGVGSRDESKREKSRGTKSPTGEFPDREPTWGMGGTSSLRLADPDSVRGEGRGTVVLSDF